MDFSLFYVFSSSFVVDASLCGARKYYGLLG
jgi:hypothetical protein